jgi:ubiquinone/menaquinone biosynthesis C-methylase UbiE
MKFTNLDESKFQLSAKEIADIFEPFVATHHRARDRDWQQALSVRKNKILRKYVKKVCLGWMPSHQRNEEFIVDEYSDVWATTDYQNYSLKVPPPRFSPWELGDDKMMASAFGGTRVRQLLLMRAIEYLKPRRVLEVGCGNGINLLMLAGRFPDIEFTGVELTREGNEAALGFQKQKVFPAEMQSSSALPVVDETAFRKIKFLRGSADDLPFEAGSFDLVYTVLALEQMERIRDKALSEVARVSGRHTLMIEPFRDVNDQGWERANVIRRNYFRGRIKDLATFGLQPREAIFDFPQEVFLKACMVWSEKMN